MTVFHRKNVSISRRRDTQSFHLISDKNVIHKSDSWPCVAPENKWSTRLRIFSIKHRRDQFFWSRESKLRLRADAPPSFHWVSGLGFADWSINSCLVDCWLKLLRVVVIWISLLALRFIEESEEFQGSIWWKESVMECGVCGSFVWTSLCSNNWDPTGADWSTSNDFSRISSDLVILEERRFLSLIFTSLLERPAERKIQSEIHFWINRQLKWR